MGFKFELFGNLKKHAAPGSKDSDNDKGSYGSLGQPSMDTSGNMGNIGPMDMNPTPSGMVQGSDATEDANRLFSQGMSEGEVVQQLKSQGYDFSQIDNALGNTIRNQVISGTQQQPQSSYGDSYGQQQVQRLQAQIQQGDQSQNNEGSYFNQQQQLEQQMDNSRFLSQRDAVEALIESIVEERLSSFKSMIDKTTGSIEELRSEIENLDKSLKVVESHTQDTSSDLRKEMDTLRDDISLVAPKVSSLEHAFKDVVPNIVDAISEINEELHMKHSGSLEKKTKADLKDISEQKANGSSSVMKHDALEGSSSRKGQGTSTHKKHEKEKF